MPNVNVSYKGPLFTHGAAPVNGAITDIIRDLTAEGESLVALQLYPGHGLKTGHYRRSINGRVTDSRHGEIHDSRVVYGPWLEGVSSRNQTTRFKGYAMFRNAKQRLEQMKARVVEKHIRRLVDRLNG